MEWMLQEQSKHHYQNDLFAARRKAKALHEMTGQVFTIGKEVKHDGIGEYYLKCGVSNRSSIIHDNHDAKRNQVPHRSNQPA